MILGIDPGFTGAIALYSPIDHSVIDVIDMPLIQPTESLFGGASERKTIDVGQMASFILVHSKNITLAVVEQVSAAPEQGVVSMFRFGEGFGMIQGVLSTIGIKTLKPIPSVWKLGMNVSADKNSSISRVALEFGGQFMAEKAPLKKHHGRCEAILLAMFGAKSLGLLKRG